MFFLAVPIHLPPGELPNPVFTHFTLTKLGTPPPNDYRAVVVAAYYSINLMQSGEIHAFYNRLNIQIIESSLVLHSTTNLYTLRVTYGTVATSSSPGVPFPPHIYARLAQPQLNPVVPNPPINQAPEQH